MNRKRPATLLLPLLAACLFGMAGRAQANSGPTLAPRSERVNTSFPAMAAFVAAAPEGATQEGQGETRELIFKTINFLILVGGLAYLLRKPLSEFFASRSAEIRTSLEEGRKALEASQAKLSAVEEKLRHLEEEIAAFKAAATREMEAERQRLRQAAAEEAERILESARARIETITRSAKLDLRFFAGTEALKQADQMIRGRLDDATHRRLVGRFVEGIGIRD